MESAEASRRLKGLNKRFHPLPFRSSRKRHHHKLDVSRLCSQELEKPKKLHLETAIVEDGRARALIVAPNDMSYRNLAFFLREKIRDLGGVFLEVLGEDEFREENYKSFNLIVLGNIENNRLIGFLYVHYYAFSDAIFPGEGGYELRTIHDPWGDGRNIILIGATDLDGAKRGVEDFLKILKPGRVLSIGRIIRVESGRIPPFIMNPSQDLMRRLEEKAITAMESEAHGNLAPYLSAAGIMYYITGNDCYAELFKRLAYMYWEYYKRPVTTTREAFGRWGFDADFYLHQMMPAWDLVEESPVFTDEDRLNITGIFIEFIRHVPPHTGQIDASGKIKPDETIRHNHATFAALGLAYAGTYFSKYYHLDEAKFWLELSDKVFAGQSKAFKPVCNCNSYQWLTLYHTLKYALVMRKLYYLESGNARKSADLAIISTDNLGYQVPYGDAGPYHGGWSQIPFLRGVAYYYRDGRYEWMIRKKTEAMKEIYEERKFVEYWPDIINSLGIHQFAVSIEPKEPVDLLGVKSFPLDREFFNYHGGHALAPYEKTFDKIVMRASYDPQKQYLLLDGLSCGGHSHPNGNAILRITDRGRIWLDDCTYMLGQMKHHNTLLVYKDGQSKVIPKFCELESIADLKEIGFSETSARDYNGVDWYRNIIWLKEKYFVILDEVEAKEDDEYGFHVIWRTVGAPIKRANSLIVNQRGVCLTIQNMDGAELKFEEDFEAGKDWVNYKYASPVVHVMRQVTDAFLRQGNRRTFINLLYTFEGEKKPVIKATRVGETQIAIHGDEIAYIGVAGEGGTVNLNISGENTLSIKTDASAYYISPSRCAVMNASFLDCGKAIFKSTSPISMELCINDEAAVIDAPNPCEITFTAEISEVKVYGGSSSLEKTGEGFKIWVKPGKYTLSLPGLSKTDFALKLENITFPEKEIKISRVKRLLKKRFGLIEVWSKKAGGKHDFTSITAVDLNNDGLNEVVAGSTDGKVYAFSSSGSEIWSFNVGGRVNSIHASDVDKDGEIEVICGLEDATIYLLDSEGRQKWSFIFPPHIGKPSVVTVFTADLNLDGREEIIAGLTNWLYFALKNDGNPLWKSEAIWPATVGCTADVDGDGRFEVLAGTKLNLSLINSDGSIRWRFSGGRDHYSPFGKGRVLDVYAGDIDGDGEVEILCACSDGYIYALNPMGRLKWRYNVGEEAVRVSAADINGDGRMEVIVGSTNFNIYSLRSNGERIWRKNLRDIIRDINLSDLNNDGKAEVISGCGNRLVILSGSGDEKAWCNVNGLINKIVISDLDNDGEKEIIVAAKNRGIFVLKSM